MKNFLKSEINTIFIMLGRKCNFNCRYCMQINALEKPRDLPTEINEDIYDFIKEIAENQNKPLTLHFYGGEPLIYFNKIKEIVQHTKQISNVKFSIITNGSLIKDQVLSFLNDNDFSVSVSWDGFKSLETRKTDVMKTNLVNILKVKRLGISCVSSHYTSPNQLLNDVQFIDDKYYNLHNYHLNINIDEIFDSGLNDKSLLDVDYDKVSSEMKSLVYNVLNYKCGKNQSFEKNYIKIQYVEQLINNVKNSIKNKNLNGVCYCGNGYWVLNLDLEGNLYSCHNTDDMLGNIYTNYFSYLENVKAFDKTEYFYNLECKKCSVHVLCKSGCKLVKDKARHESYCRLKKAVYKPVIEGIIEYTKNL